MSIVTAVGGKVEYDGTSVITEVSFATAQDANGDQFVRSVTGHHKTLTYVKSVSLRASVTTCRMFGASGGSTKDIDLKQAWSTVQGSGKTYGDGQR